MSFGQKVFWGCVALFVLAALFLIATRPVSSGKQSIGALVADPASLPGLMTDTGPWGANIGTLAARLDAMGFPRLSMEGSVMHIHQHVDIYIHDQRVVVPADIGISGFFSPIHVHDETGIIHVESPVDAKFYLGQFFDVWGLKFTSTCIGGYCSDANDSLKVYVNGKLQEGDPRSIELMPHAEIAIVYGTSAEIPATIPSSYAFPVGD